MTLLSAFSLQFPLLWGGFLFIFGLTFGSFFNVVIHRLPLMMRQEESARFNLCVPASFCPQCQRPLIWRDNIPLLSYLSLKGRARCCQAPISQRYPLTELASGLLFVLAGYLLTPGLPLLGGLILLSTLLVLAIIDGQTQLLPDRLTLPLLWAGLLFNLNGTFVPLSEAVIGAMTGYLSLWTVYWLFRLLTGKEALGYGDFKLLAALGAWSGWQILPQTLLCASASGLIWTLLQRRITLQSLDQPAGLRPLAGAGGQRPVSVDSDAVTGARQARLRILFGAPRSGAVLAGSSGQTCLG